jgi:FAD/FMN-containing dehydrogenase
MAPAEFFALAQRADHEVFALVQAHGGTISAEHGIGLVKKPYLEYSRSATELEVMRAVKRALDPDGIMNPGKIFDT